ncbi:MAG: Ig-like domain-containing protein [Oscillospiraceae bacterium]|nr:Ig-like domain-containing protein [Oscillospiraceae bacterium]
MVLGEDTSITLPTTVSVTYSDGNTYSESVSWDAADCATVDAALTAGTAGTYTVNGTLNDGTAVACTVVIKYANLIDSEDASFEISSADASAKFTVTGSGINLPATDDPYDGSYSMHWYLTTATTSSVTYNEAFTLSAGSYTFECVAQGYAGDTVTLKILDANGNVLYSGNPASMNGWNDWQTPTVSFTISEETVIKLQVEVSMQAEGWGTVDSLYLYQTAVASVGEVEPSGNSTSKIDILMRIQANYAAVTSAIAKANALNPSDYVDFSGVTAAINAVNWNLNVLNQTAVNAYAEAIETAIANLIPIEAEEVEVDEPVEACVTETEPDDF